MSAPQTPTAAPLDPAVRAVLDGTPIAHVATVLPDGGPHTVPVWIGLHDDHPDQVLFLTGPGSRKARNLRRDPRVAISMTVPDDPFHPVALRGRVTGWLTGDDAWPVADAIAHKYIGQPYGRDQ